MPFSTLCKYVFGLIIREPLPPDGRLRSVHRMRVSVGLVPGTGDLSLSGSLPGRLPARSRSNLPFGQDLDRAGARASKGASERASVGASRTDQPVCVRRHDIRASDAVRDWDKLHVCLFVCLASSRDGSPFPSLTDQSAPKRDHRCSFVRPSSFITHLCLSDGRSIRARVRPVATLAPLDRPTDCRSPAPTRDHASNRPVRSGPVGRRGGTGAALRSGPRSSSSEIRATRHFGHFRTHHTPYI